MDEFERYRRRRAVRGKRLTALGVTNVRCLCGETDPLCFDVEHIFRRGYDSTTWGRCANCHRKKTAREWSEHPPVGLHPGNRIEKMAHALRGMVEYESFIVGHLQDMADKLDKLAARGIDLED